MMSDGEYKGNGYSGISMSNNAVAAYASGEKPISRWKKQDIIKELKSRNVSDEFIKAASYINLSVLKNFLLYKKLYHHTGMRFNETDFYALKDIPLDKEADLLQEMVMLQKEYKKNKDGKNLRNKSNKSTSKFILAEIEYMKRTADGKHSYTISGEGIINGDRCYLKDRHRKKVSGKDFYIINKLRVLPDDFSLEQFYDDMYEYEVHKNY